jgi:hypothetical protein
MTTVRRIFLAHAREDKSQVRKLYADLKSRGLDPWLDEIDLMPGQIWKDEIPKAIRGAAVFLACLSSRSVDKVGYVQNEFRLALSAFGERPPGSIYLIPVRLDDCNVPDLQIADRGLSLKDIHWVDLWQEGGLDRLVTSIGRTLAVGTPSPQVVEAPSTHPPSATGSVIVQGDYSGLTTVFTAPHDTREARALSVRHPAIVAAIIGALGLWPPPSHRGYSNTFQTITGSLSRQRRRRRRLRPLGCRRITVSFAIARAVP